MKTHALACAALVLLTGVLSASRPAATRPATAAAAAAIASFSFETDATDDAGHRAKATLKHAPVQGGVLVLNGNYEYGMALDGYRAEFRVPSLDYGSFAVSWRFKADSFEETPQGRERCLLSGGTSYRWFAANRLPSGKLQIAFNNGDVAFDVADTKIRAGEWTHLACSVDLAKRRALVVLQGRRLADIELPKDFSLRVIGSDVEEQDREFAFTNYSTGETFHGQIDEFVVFARALSADEMIPLWQRHAGGAKAGE